MIYLVPECCWLAVIGLAGCWLLAPTTTLLIRQYQAEIGHYKKLIVLVVMCLLAAGCWLLAAGCWLVPVAVGCWLVSYNSYYYYLLLLLLLYYYTLLYSTLLLSSPKQLLLLLLLP